MKRITAFILVALALLSVPACTDGGDAPMDQSDERPSAETSAESSGDAGTPDITEFTAASGFGFYDPDYNYFQNPRFKVVGMFFDLGFYAPQDEMFKLFAEKANVEYTTYDAKSDVEALNNSIALYAAQGFDGAIVQTMATEAVSGRLNELMTEAGMKFASGSPPRGYDSKWFHPWADFDNYQRGYRLGKFMSENVTNEWPDAKPEEIRYAFIDCSIVEEMHLACIGFWYGVHDIVGDDFEKYWIYADIMSSGGDISENGVFDLTSTLFANNPDVKYWVIGAGGAESFGYGSAAAAASYNITDNVLIGNTIGDAIFKDWDQGIKTSFKYALAAADVFNLQSWFFQLYAYMMDWCTPEQIWFDYINPSDQRGGGVYATLFFNAQPLNVRDYRNYLAWTDTVSGFPRYPEYEWDGVTQYEMLGGVTDSPKGQVDVAFDPTNGMWTK
jgi:ABC-type sugar transport system substrate-binding protein